MQSLAVIKSLRPTCIYPGHGPVVSDPESHIQMYIEHRNNREKQIMRALVSGTTEQLFTAMDLVKIIYTVNYFIFFICRMTLQTTKLKVKIYNCEHHITSHSLHVKTDKNEITFLCVIFHSLTVIRKVKIYNCELVGNKPPCIIVSITISRTQVLYMCQDVRSCILVLSSCLWRFSIIIISYNVSWQINSLSLLCL